MIKITCKGECRLPLKQGMNRVLSNFVPCFHFLLSEKRKKNKIGTQIQKDLKRLVFRLKSSPVDELGCWCLHVHGNALA